MKQEDKEMICEWLDRFVESIEKAESNSIAHLEQFKKDNNLFSEDKLNKWLVNDNSKLWLGFTDGEGLFYGIDAFGNSFYFENEEYRIKESDRVATESEVQERLTKLALKLGYCERQSECLSGYGSYKIDLESITFDFRNGDNTLLIEDINCKRNVIFDNGIWADFICEPTEIEQLMEEIEKLKEKVSKLKG